MKKILCSLMICYFANVCKTWKVYFDVLDDDKKDGSSLLMAIDNCISKVWFEGQHIGLATIGNWMKLMAEQENIEVKVTNKTRNTFTL